MFRYTRGDLAKKTNTQLSALFKLATERLSVHAEPKASEANALLALVKAEMRRRLEP